MNGITLFQTDLSKCTYNKTETPVELNMGFTHLLSSKKDENGYDTIATISQYDGILFSFLKLHSFLECVFNGVLNGSIINCKSLFPIPKIKMKAALYVYKRK